MEDYHRNPMETGAPPANFLPPMANIEWVKQKFPDIPYDTKSRAQKLDIYLSQEGEGPFPVLMHIHGGGFAIGDKRDDHLNAYLEGVRRGVAVASVEYRLSRESLFPGAVLDVRQAMRFLRINAAKYSIDSNKIIALGGSSGGNLAAILAMNIPKEEVDHEDKMFSEKDIFKNLFA